MKDINLVLGLAAGYHYGDVRPFLLSLAETGYSGECVLFVSETTRDISRMEDAGATVVRFVKEPELEHLPYNALRYFLYLDFLRATSVQYDKVLISDVRDVIFQTDPFAYPWAEGINCTLEDPRIRVGECPHNSRWIRGHQGPDILAAVAHQAISCSGTTMGDQTGMMQYLEELISGLLPFEPAERMAGYDQGVHNVLVHSGRVAPIKVYTNDGPILTLGYTCGEPNIDADGSVLNGTGDRPVIVHQYDRKPYLFKLIRQRYV